MRSCHSIQHCSPRGWSGLELSQQKATRNTGSAEHLAYASFLPLAARRSNLSSFLFIANEQSRSEAPEEGGRHAPHQSHAHGWHEKHFEFTIGEPRFPRRYALARNSQAFVYTP